MKDKIIQITVNEKGLITYGLSGKGNVYYIDINQWRLSLESPLILKEKPKKKKKVKKL